VDKNENSMLEQLSEMLQLVINNEKNKTNLSHDAIDELDSVKSTIERLISKKEFRARSNKITYGDF